MKIADLHDERQKTESRWKIREVSIRDEIEAEFTDRYEANQKKSLEIFRSELSMIKDQIRRMTRDWRN